MIEFAKMHVKAALKEASEKAETDYTYDEVLKIYSETFLNWVGQNRINYKRQIFNKQDEFTWNYYLEHPEFLTLLNSANLHKARHIQESPNVRALNSPLIELLGEILEKGRLSGEFRGGIDPVQLYVSIAALSYFYLSNNSTLSSIFGRDLMSPKAKSERLSHMCEVILGYVLRN